MNSLKNNIASLLVLQLSTYILPLITFPYLTRILGPEGFGLLGFAQGIIAYATLLTDWGFNLSASQQIARQQDDRLAVSRVFWETMAAKAFLMMISLAALLLVVFAIPRLRSEYAVLLATWLAVPASLLTPSWFLQGVEKLGRFASVSIAGRIVAVPLILCLVKKPGDAWIAALIQSSGLMVSALLSILIVWRMDYLHWHVPAWSGTFRQIRRGYGVFVASAAINIYTASNSVILGAVAGVREVGYFSGADRIRGAAQGLLAPLNTAIFPRANAMIAKSEAEAIPFLRRVLVVQGGVGLFITLGLLLSSHWLVVLILGQGYAGAETVLRWLSLLPVVIALSNVFGIQVMLGLGKQKAFTRILLISSALNMALIFPMVHFYGAVGAAATMLVVEVFVTTAMGIYINYAGIPLFRSEIPAREDQSK